MSMPREQSEALSAIPEPDRIFNYFKGLGVPFVYRCKPYEKRSMGCNYRDREIDDHGPYRIGPMSDEMAHVFQRYNLGRIKVRGPEIHVNYSYTLSLAKDDDLSTEAYLRSKMKEVKHQGETVADFKGVKKELPYWPYDLSKPTSQPMYKAKPFRDRV